MDVHVHEYAYEYVKIEPKLPDVPLFYGTMTVPTMPGCSEQR